MSNNHQDLDALPLPEPLVLLHTGDDFGGERDDPELEFNSFNAAAEFCLSKPAKTEVGLHSDDALRAYGLSCYELAMRKAQEGREPVAWRVRRSDGEHELFFHEPTAKQRAECFVPHSSAEPLFTAPPPKSDEARDAERLLIAAQAVVDWHGELGHDSLAMAELRAALAAQQKGGV